LSHNFEDDVETKIEVEALEIEIDVKDESPISMYINLDNTI